VDSKFKEKMNSLEDLNREYNIGPILFEEIKQSLKFDIERDKSDTLNFIEFLPHRIKVDLSVKIHQEIVH
jgi:hypothetical protein